MNLHWTCLEGSGPMNYVMLHGFMGRGEDLLPLAKNLPGSVFLPDLPGHGQSSLFKDFKPQSFLEVVDALISDLKVHNPDNLVIYGYSLGGRLAAHMLFREPKLFQGALLESSSLGIVDPKLREVRFREDLENLSDDTFLDFLTSWYSMELFQGLTPEQKEYLIKDRFEHNKIKELRAAQRVLSVGAMPELQSAQWPPIPWKNFHYVCGMLDKKYVQNANWFKDHFPEAIVSLIPEAGHNVHIIFPEAIQRILLTLG